MANDILYMLGIVAVGFALNFGLRALPFVIFGTRKGELPPWIARFSAFISPVIITGLIVYSYSGLAWKTAWPYLAGLLTVGLQLWRKNALVSIVAGTLVYMCLLTCGCATQHREVPLDAQHPTLRMEREIIYFEDETVDLEDVVDCLEDSDIPTTQTIHIQIDPTVTTDLKPARALIDRLRLGGYNRAVLVTRRHASSRVVDSKKKKKWTKRK